MIEIRRGKCSLLEIQELGRQLESEAFAAKAASPHADALRLRSDSLGFEAEVNGDRNVRGNGLAVPRCWFVLVFLQGLYRGRAQ
jgi:hypothetical protein